MKPAHCDVLVVGGGPAGMAAATTAAGLGLSTRLLDEQRAPGGQIYRGITTVPAALAQRLGADYTRGRTLAAALAASGVDAEFDATVFDLDAELNVAWLAGGAAREVAARHLILATGAMERATPVPGWTLPGVMYAGAAQLLLKTAASVPSGRVVLAGNGPLLLLVANQLADAGADVVAVVETTRFADMLGAARHLPRALRAGGTLVKGLAMMRALRQRGLRWIRGAAGSRSRVRSACRRCGSRPAAARKRSRPIPCCCTSASFRTPRSRGCCGSSTSTTPRRSRGARAPIHGAAARIRA